MYCVLLTLVAYHLGNTVVPLDTALPKLVISRGFLGLPCVWKSLLMRFYNLKAILPPAQTVCQVEIVLESLVAIIYVET